MLNITLPTRRIPSNLSHFVKFWMAKVLKNPLRTKTFMNNLSRTYLRKNEASELFILHFN